MPVVLSDDFLLPFVGSTGGGGLMPLHVVDSFALRVPEDAIDQLPVLLHAAAARHAEMLRNLHVYRHAFLYELPTAGQPAAMGAVCAVMADVSRRFKPHLQSWRDGRALSNTSASSSRERS